MITVTLVLRRCAAESTAHGARARNLHPLTRRKHEDHRRHRRGPQLPPGWPPAKPCPAQPPSPTTPWSGSTSATAREPRDPLRRGQAPGRRGPAARATSRYHLPQPSRPPAPITSSSPGGTWPCCPPCGACSRQRTRHLLRPLVRFPRPGRSGEPARRGHQPRLRRETAKKGSGTGPLTACDEAGFTAPGPDISIAVQEDGVAAVAMPVRAPGRDNGLLGFPCLSHCSFQLDRSGTLHAMAHYRSHLMVERAYGIYLWVEDASWPYRQPVRTGNRRTDCHRRVCPAGLPGPPVCPARRFRGSRRGVTPAG